MLQRGLNQAELAKKMKVSHVQISRYLKGMDYPTWPKIKALIRALNCKPEELLGEIPSATTVTTDAKTVTQEQLLAALKEYGFPESALDFVRRLFGSELEPWQVAAVDAIIKGGKKKEG